MKYLRLHRWRVTPREAAQIQLRLRNRVERRDRFGPIERVAGADLAYDLESHRAIAGVVVYRFPHLQEIERVWAARPVGFPYVPGLLSFRELPALLQAFSSLRTAPQLIFYDGHGYAHPRRFGIACHLGVLLDCPTIGCAKSILVGEADEPGVRAGSSVRLRDGAEVLGAVLRTREGVKPVYVSAGHRISLESALRFVRAVSDGYRIPRPTRDADHFVAQVKRGTWGPAKAAPG